MTPRERVDAFVSTHDRRAPPAHRLLDLSAAVGGEFADALFSC
ncbi:hypothetical protein ACNS7O_10820 [Haloferacaceae archaeon DSL9]